MSALLDRERELAELDAIVAEAAEGHGRMVLMEGPAGIGKSGLLIGLRERAGGRMRVLAARSSELEREFGFGVVRQLFEGAVAEDRDRALAGAAATAAPLFAVGGEGQGDGEAAASFAALHGLYWLTLNLAAERPLLLAVDDLHWCDRPSLRFLAYLARRLDGAPVLAAATLRTGEPGTDPALLAEIVHDPAATPLRPGPLGADAVAALVHAELGGRRGARVLRRLPRRDRRQPAAAAPAPAHARGRGHRARRPRTSTAVRAVGPRAVASTVLLRLARLPADAAAVTRAAAVLGESAELPVIAALAGRRRGGGGQRDAARSCGPRSCGRSRRSASSTRSCATPSTTSSARRAGAPARARRARPARARRTGGAGRRAAPDGPAAR